jgi:CubicO group peptidase (beta-lactamase class C family)
MGTERAKRSKHPNIPDQCPFLILTGPDLLSGGLLGTLLRPDPILIINMHPRHLLPILMIMVPVHAQDLPPAVARARSIVIDSMAAGRIPGVSITVTRHGQTIWSEGFGYADLEQRVPATPQTRFRVGSISKAMTSVALGLLWEEGRIHFDSTVQTYVPSFPRKRWPITIRQVAGHLAGIRHYRGREMYISKSYPTVASSLTIFQDDSLLSPPGSRYLYSSYGWNLLSAVTEGASGKEFLSFMQRRVFTPLGMTQTMADHVDSIIAGRARWYTEDSLGTTVNAPFVDNSHKWAGGGFLSTTEDLARFGNAMLTGQLLKKATVDTLWKVQRLNDGRPTVYGIGWFNRPDPSGRPTVGHAGGSIGGTAQLLIWPEEQLVVAMLVNSDRPFIHHAQRVAEELLRK